MAKIRRFFSNFIDLSALPSFEIPPEKETELIEKLAKTISKYEMELPAIFIGSAFRPVATIMSYTTFLPPATMLEFIGISAYDYLALIAKKENVQRLIDRLDELHRAREEKR